MTCVNKECTNFPIWFWQNGQRIGGKWSRSAMEPFWEFRQTRAFSISSAAKSWLSRPINRSKTPAFNKVPLQKPHFNISAPSYSTDNNGTLQRWQANPEALAAEANNR